MRQQLEQLAGALRYAQKNANAKLPDGTMFIIAQSGEYYNLSPDSETLLGIPIIYTMDTAIDIRLGFKDYSIDASRLDKYFLEFF